MKQKGFTMVELIAVIAILGVIMIIVIPSVANVSKNTKESLLNAKISTITSSAEKYGNDNINLYQKCTSNLESNDHIGDQSEIYKDCLLTIENLVSYGYLKNDTKKNNVNYISNPVTSEKIKGKVLLCYDPKTIHIIAKYYSEEDKNYSCPAVYGDVYLDVFPSFSNFYWNKENNQNIEATISSNKDMTYTCKSNTDSFTCKIENKKLIIIQNKNITPDFTESHYVTVTGKYKENAEDITLTKNHTINVKKVVFQITDANDNENIETCMPVLSNERLKINEENAGTFNLSYTGDGLSATINQNILYLSSGNTPGLASLKIEENNAGLSKTIDKIIYDLKFVNDITNIIVGDTSEKLNLSYGQTGKLIVKVTSASGKTPLKISKDNKNFYTSLELTKENIIYLKGYEVGEVTLTITGEKCGQITKQIHVTNIKLEKTTPDFMFFDGGKTPIGERTDTTKFISKIIADDISNLSCKSNDNYLDCNIEGGLLTLTTTDGEGIADNIKDKEATKVIITSPTEGTLEFNIPIIYKTSLTLRENNRSVNYVCQKYNDTSSHTISIYGTNVGKLTQQNNTQTCDPNTQNIFYKEMSDYYLANIGSSVTEPKIEIKNNCGDSKSYYGYMTLNRHNVTISELDAAPGTPYQKGYNNTGVTSIYLKENNGNRLAQIDYRVYKLEVDQSTISIDTGGTKTIKVTYAATGNLNYRVSNENVARITRRESTYNENENSEINKEFTDTITITGNRRGRTKITITGAGCGSIEITVNVTSTFSINLTGGKYGKTTENVLTCRESAFSLTDGCDVILPAYDYKTGTEARGWSTYPNSEYGEYSVGDTIHIDRYNSGTTYYAIIYNPSPVCTFTSVPDMILDNSTANIFLTCTDKGGGLSPNDLTINDFQISNDNAKINSVIKEKSITDGYSYIINLLTTANYGPFTVTLKEGAVKDTYDLPNESITTKEIVHAKYKYENYYRVGDNAYAFIYDNQNVDQTNGYTLEITGSGETYDCDTPPWNNYSSNITNILTSDEITYLGNNLFYNTNISKINLPANLTKIGESTFANSSLETLNLPDNLEEIGKRAFTNNENLTTITLGKNLKIISEYAFNNNSSLVNILLNDNLEEIKDYAFSGAPIESIKLPASLKTIGSYAFYGNKSEKIELNESLETLGTTPFRGTNFKELTSLSPNFQVESNLLYKDNNLLLVPDNIGGNIQIKEGTTNLTFDSLNGFVVDNNTKMTINIPSSLEQINTKLNLNIASFIVHTNNQNYSSLNGILLNKDADTLINIPVYFNQIEYTLTKNITIIKSYSINNNIILETLTLEGIKTIENNAIYGDNYGIKTIYIENGQRLNRNNYTLNHNLTINTLS